MERLASALLVVRKGFLAICLLLLAVLVGGLIWQFVPWESKGFEQESKEAPEIGDVVDELNGVKIFYNGSVGNTSGRRRSEDGYNYGLGFQCVEFVKRYYFDHLNHRMPDTWGHARDFFDQQVRHGELNVARALVQYRNGGGERPAVNDLIVFGPTEFNQYGHVAIICGVDRDGVEIAQQNPGPNGKSRVRIPWIDREGCWKLSKAPTLGWLRIPEGR